MQSGPASRATEEASQTCTAGSAVHKTEGLELLMAGNKQGAGAGREPQKRVLRCLHPTEANVSTALSRLCDTISSSRVVLRANTPDQVCSDLQQAFRTTPQTTISCQTDCFRNRFYSWVIRLLNSVK
ncbi:uncharacterized, partial [Lates japonicus]